MDVYSDVSALSMFYQASVIVKIILLVLCGFSVSSWAVIFMKLRELRKHFKDVCELEVVLSEHGSCAGMMDIVESGSGLAPQILQYGLRNTKLVENKKEGFHRFVSAELSRSMLVLEEHVELLATIGSSAPYIGLLGTILSIAKSINTLGEVHTGEVFLAPDIVSALSVAALGLAVAIPANIFYSRFTASITKISNRLSNLVFEIGTLIAEDLPEDSSRTKREIL